MSAFEGNSHQLAFAGLALAATVVGSIASIIMLMLIRNMGTWNGHLLLITTMTIFQLIYDFSFFTGVVDTGVGVLTIVSNITQLFSGILSSLVSNWVAWVAFYVIYYKCKFEIFRYYPRMVLLATVPACFVVTLFCLAVAETSNDEYIRIALLLYNFVKICSIFINCVLIAWTAVLIRRMRSGSVSRSRSAAETSINELVIRLFYYPLVQILSRSGCAWYEMQYGYNFSPSEGMNFDPTHTSTVQFIAQCLMTLSMPIASVGYLVIFLRMHPKAFANACSYFGITLIDNSAISRYQDNCPAEGKPRDVCPWSTESESENVKEQDDDRHPSIASSLFDDESTDLTFNLLI
jgi:hypothetical protein